VPGSRVRTTREETPGRVRREPNYAMVLKVRARDSVEASRELSRLVALIHNTLDGVAYKSYCLFDACYVNSDEDQYDEPPNYMAGLTGQFAYVVDLSTGMKATR
jgi:hypothetical protein